MKCIVFWVKGLGLVSLQLNKNKTTSLLIPEGDLGLLRPTNLPGVPKVFHRFDVEG